MRCSLLAVSAFSLLLSLTGGAEASCPSEITPPSLFTFRSSDQGNVVFISYFTMGRRSPTMYAATKYGAIGAYLGTNPASPTPKLDNVSFRAGGPVGGGGTADCWPGPTGLAAADSSSGAGRIGLTWEGCGSTAQALIINPPGGTSNFGQQISPSGTKSTVYAGLVAAAFTTGGKYAEYYGDSKGVYAVDVTNLSGSADSTPLVAMQTLTSWANASFATIGDSSADKYLVGVFTGAKTLAIASIGSDGRLTPLSTTASLSSGGALGSGAQKIASYSTGNGYYIFVCVASGIDVFSFNGTTLTALGTIPNVSSTDQYTLIQVPSLTSSVVLAAERRASHQIDLYSGGFLSGQAGSPTLKGTIPALSGDPGSGFGAYISADDARTLYIYRVYDPDSILSIQTDVIDITCVTSPPTPNPVADFALVNKSAQARADKGNYVGDTFSLTDSSQAGSGGSITNWYLWPVYSAGSSTKANATSPNTSAPAYANLILPCTGGISAGQCSYSWPGGLPGSTISETFGELVSAGTLDSAVSTRSVSLTVPMTSVAGVNVDGSVKLLSGSGQIDASPSTGSPSGFTWSFLDAQSGVLTTSCAAAKCTPPATAQSFSVAADYAGGYQANFVSGTIAFTDVAGAVTVPGTVYSSQGTIPITIALQKGGSVVVSSITEAIDDAAPSTLSVSLAGNSSGSTSVTGSTTVPIPAGLTPDTNHHTITFVVNYTGGNLGSSVTFADPFFFSTVAYDPHISISTTNTAPPNNNALNQIGKYALSPNVTYYFGDMGDFSFPEQPATWDFGDGTQSASTTSTIVAHSYSGTGTKTVQLTVQGVTVPVTVSISGTAPPSFSVGTISGPSSVIQGNNGSFTASVSGGTAPYTYSWTSTDSGSSSSATFNHNFAATGTFTVSLTASDSAGHTQTKTKSVSVTSGDCTSGCPTNQIAIAGPSAAATSSPATWTASVSGATGPLSISWYLTGNGVTASGLGTTFNYTFAAAGTYTLTASGNMIIGASPVPLVAANKTIVVSGFAGPSPNFSIVGATFTQFANPQYSAKAGDVITFVGAETNDSPTFTWDFGDSTSGTGATVTHSFQQKGNYSVKMTVKNAHQLTASSNLRIGITGQAFAALFIPGAGHLTSGAGAYATALSVFNNSASPVTISLDFQTNQLQSVDPSKLGYPFSITLDPHHGASTTDVTNGVLGIDGIGTLFIKYSGSVAPSVQARIYYSAGGAGDPTYGTYLPAYSTNGNGQALGGISTAPQNIVGLKFDQNFTGGLTLVSASPSGGHFDVNLFRDDGTTAGATVHMIIPGFQQVKLAASDFAVSADPGHIYYAIVTPSPSFPATPVIAIGTVTDNRTRDSLLLIDDTPRLATPPGGSAIYYVAGAGRTTSGAKTDLYLLNTSAYGIGSTSGNGGLNFRFHYSDGTGEHTAQVSELQFIGAHQALQISDVVTTLFPGIVGQVVGDLRIDYQTPNDNAPLIIEARNYTDSGAGSFGMQLPAYAATDGLVSGSASQIVIAGLHNDFNTASNAYDNISKFGFIALGDTHVRVHADAYDQFDGSLFWSGDYDLNSGTLGHFVYQPTTGDGTDAFTAHPAFNLVINAPAISDGGTPVAAFATVQDVNSKDLVFIPGKKPATAQ
jgi:PKD repeat protein